MTLQLSYFGTTAEAQQYFDMFNNLHPAAVRKYESVPPTGIMPAASQDIDSGIWYVPLSTTKTQATLLIQLTLPARKVRILGVSSL